MDRAGRQYKQFLNVLGTGQIFDLRNQPITTVRTAIFRMYCDAGHLRHGFFRERIQRGTGDNHAVTFNDEEVIDLHFQLFAGTFDQNTFCFQRADQIHDATDIINGGRTGLFCTVTHDLRTDTITGEQFLNQCTIFPVTDQMTACHTATAGRDSRAEITGCDRAVITGFFKADQVLFSLFRE